MRKKILFSSIIFFFVTILQSAINAQNYYHPFWRPPPRGCLWCPPPENRRFNRRYNMQPSMRPRTFYSTEAPQTYYSTEQPPPAAAAPTQFPITCVGSNSVHRHNNQGSLGMESQNSGRRVQYHLQGFAGAKSYKFGFQSGDKCNQQTRHEERDKDGLVKGQYSFVDPNGRLRVVSYEADPVKGFTVTINQPPGRPGMRPPGPMPPPPPPPQPQPMPPRLRSWMPNRDRRGGGGGRRGPF